MMKKAEQKYALILNLPKNKRLNFAVTKGLDIKLPKPAPQRR